MQKQKIRPAGQERIKKPAQSGTRGYTVKNTITFGNDSALVSLRNLCFDNTADVLTHDTRFCTFPSADAGRLQDSGILQEQIVYSSGGCHGFSPCFLLMRGSATVSPDT